MIVLDTNVVSELMRDEPDPQVKQWISSQLIEKIWISAMTLLEIERGLLKLVPGATHSGLVRRFRELIDENLSGHILPLGAQEATSSAALIDHQSRMGKPLHLADAVKVLRHLTPGALLLTRDVALLAALGDSAVNPWAAPASN